MIGPSPRHPLPLWWLLWGAFFSGIFVVAYLLAPGGPAVDGVRGSGGENLWMVASAPFWLSVLIRWVGLPRVRSSDRQLGWAAFIVGLALAELPCFAGLFVFRDRWLELFGLSLLGMAQWVPVFAGRFVDGEGKGTR